MDQYDDLHEIVVLCLVILVLILHEPTELLRVRVDFPLDLMLHRIQTAGRKVANVASCYVALRRVTSRHVGPRRVASGRVSGLRVAVEGGG